MERDEINRVLSFWFGDLKENEAPSEAHRKMWWIKDTENDNRIKDNFGNDLRLAIDGELDDWKKSPEGSLALIILLDQFSRNIYRDTNKAFSQDEMSLQICTEGIDNGFDKELHPVKRILFNMPLMHSESMDMQEKSLECFSGLAQEFTEPESIASTVSNSYQYALRHYEIIKRFGRYPHRNEILGRESTTEEIEFLGEPGSSF